MVRPEAPTGPGRELRSRYTVADLAVFSPDEARRFVPDGQGDPQIDSTLAWEMLYRLEPELYDRLVSAERLHEGILSWLPDRVNRIVEVGAGAGRLTLQLVDRGQEIVAIEPSRPLREILKHKLKNNARGDRVQVISGFFDDLPVATDFADLVAACSAFTPASAHGGDVGLAEMERVCRPGGVVVIVWPNNVDWLVARGYEYLCFEGEMYFEFASSAEAVELAEIFYPHAVSEVRQRGQSRVPYELLGINPPRDLAFKMAA